jgi:hypothetical protein
MSGMRDFILLFVHVIATMARLAGPGGLRSVVAESALLRHQLLILNRGRKRAPNLRATDRITAGLLAHLISQARILRSAIVLKPSTLLCLHSRLNESTACCFRLSAGVAPARRDRTKNSSTPSWP